MPRPTLKIVASQRDALYEQVRNHLAGLGDVVVALECQRDYSTAERLAVEFGEDGMMKRRCGYRGSRRVRAGCAGWRLPPRWGRVRSGQMRKTMNMNTLAKRNTYAPPAPVSVKAVNASAIAAVRADPIVSPSGELRCIVFIVPARQARLCRRVRRSQIPR